MMRRFGWVVGFVFYAVGAGWFYVAAVSGVSAEPAARECRILSCDKCRKVCGATCDADYKVCTAQNKRDCPRAARSCQRGCTFEFCAQCMPVQYDGKNRKFLPGKTELCRTPGRPE